MQAARCAELAVAARTPQLKATFLALSKNWEKLAVQLEDADAKLTESEVIRAIGKIRAKSVIGAG